MKTILPTLAVSLVFSVSFLALPPTLGADNTMSVSLAEAMKLLEGVPNLEGKSKEEVEKIVESNPDIIGRVNRAERKVRSALDEMGLGKDNASLAEAMKELDSISELHGKSEEEIRRIMSDNPDVRHRVSSVGRRLSSAVSGGSTMPEEEPRHDTESEKTEESPVPDEIETDPPEIETKPPLLDDVFLGEFHWDFGGFDGGKAEKSEVRIAGLKVKKNGLSFEYIEDLSHWGLAYEDYTGALACLFVCDRDGRWIGGKFDWISSSRTTRDFENIYDGYEGWSLHNVPNPCPVAFVIVSPNGKKRSNVIAGIWER